jgi:hypothetical protein
MALCRGGEAISIIGEGGGGFTRHQVYIADEGRKRGLHCIQKGSRFRVQGSRFRPVLPEKRPALDLKVASVRFYERGERLHENGD